MQRQRQDRLVLDRFLEVHLIALVVRSPAQVIKRQSHLKRRCRERQALAKVLRETLFGEVIIDMRGQLFARLNREAVSLHISD